MAAVVNPKIASLIASVVDRDDGKIIAVVDEIMRLLEEDGHVYKMRIPPRNVGIHFANRDGFGCSGVECQALGSEIFDVGFSFLMTAGATCQEDDDSKTIAHKSFEISAASPGLAKIPVSEIKFGAVACTHTNQFLVAALCAVECDIESISEFGKISRAKLETDAKMKEALELGLTWTVLSSIVTDLYGTELIEMISHARNEPGRVQRKTGVVQALVKIQSMVTQQSKSKSNIDWNVIGRALAMRRSVDPEDLPILMKFVQVYGGGSSGKFVHEIDRFVKNFMPAGRVIPVDTFAAVNDLKLQPHELSPHVAAAIIKTQASCPPNKVQNINDNLQPKLPFSFQIRPFSSWKMMISKC